MQLRDRCAWIDDAVWSSWVREFDFPTKAALHDTKPNTVPEGGCSARQVKGLEGMGGHCEDVIRQFRAPDEDDDDEEEDDRLTAAHRIVWAAVKLVTALVVPTSVLRKKHRDGFYHMMKKRADRDALLRA